MGYKEDWLSLRQTSKLLSREAQLEPFCRWVDEYAKGVNKLNGAYSGYLALEQEKRIDRVRRLLKGEIVVFGNGPQVECMILASLFNILTFGHCVVVSNMRVTSASFNKMVRGIEELEDGLTVGAVGGISTVRSYPKFKDAMHCKLIIGSYLLWAMAMRTNPEIFEEGLPLMFLEIDSSLYANRLVFYEGSRPKVASMIYNSQESVLPLWKGQENVLDIHQVMMMHQFEFSGSVSYIDKVSAQQLKIQFPEWCANQKLEPYCEFSFSAFTYRKNRERCSAIIRDIMRQQEDVIVFCNEDSIQTVFKEEMRLAGQDFLSVKDTEDLLTEQALKKTKQVYLMHYNVSSLTDPPPEKHKVRIFYLDMALGDHFYTKIYAAISRICDVVGDVSIYFSLEDLLMEIYKDTCHYDLFFDLMEFTEKYDPFRQIRRFLSKIIFKKFNKMRYGLLTDNMPVGVSSFPEHTSHPSIEAIAQKASRVNKMIDGLCFCGSGKLFKDCHGKPKA